MSWLFGKKKKESLDDDDEVDSSSDPPDGDLCTMHQQPCGFQRQQLDIAAARADQIDGAWVALTA